MWLLFRAHEICLPRAKKWRMTLTCWEFWFVSKRYSCKYVLRIKWLTFDSNGSPRIGTGNDGNVAGDKWDKQGLLCWCLLNADDGGGELFSCRCWSGTDFGSGFVQQEGIFLIIPHVLACLQHAWKWAHPTTGHSHKRPALKILRRPALTFKPGLLRRPALKLLRRPTPKLSAFQLRKLWKGFWSS